MVTGWARSDRCVFRNLGDDAAFGVKISADVLQPVLLVSAFHPAGGTSAFCKISPLFC
jgi:hypothetical protein